MMLVKMATIIWSILISILKNKWRELLNNNMADNTYHISVDLPVGEAGVVDECMILVVSEIKYYRCSKFHVCYMSKRNTRLATYT